VRRRLAAEVLRVTVVAALVEIGLRVSRLPRIARWCGVDLDLTSAPPQTLAPLQLPARTRRQVQAVDLVMRRWPLGDTCLRRCLVLGQRMRELDPVLRIGVADGPDGVRAHSWLEICGHSLDDGIDEFAAFGAAR
jgi:hypothetical protein